jgi:hypothetical protein
MEVRAPFNVAFEPRHLRTFVDEEMSEVSADEAICSGDENSLASPE